MNIKILPSKLQGAVRAPASKSSMQRACAAALLHPGRSILHNPGNSDDDKAALGIITQLGAEAHAAREDLIIESKGVHPVGNQLACGESGLSIRMFTPLAALSDQETHITGTGSLLSRPMDFFNAILPQVGVSVRSNDGHVPLHIKGPLQPATITIDGSLSSQYLTGLLLAYSARGAKDVTIHVTNLKSRPYVDLTLDVMHKFGMKMPVNQNHQAFHFDGSDAPDNSGDIEYTVEGDWSGGAFLLVAGAIAGPVTVRGLDLNSTQADKAIMDVLISCNAAFAVEAKGIIVHPSEMRAFNFDATDCPDLFPPLVALAAYCKGTSTIMGVSRLTNKESNRALTLQEEFGKMGLNIKLDGDKMIIQSTGKLKGAKVHSRHDHRIAMATAVAALRAEGETEIGEAEAVGKSYPAFFHDIISVQAQVSGMPVYKI